MLFAGLKTWLGCAIDWIVDNVELHENGLRYCGVWRNGLNNWETVSTGENWILLYILNYFVVLLNN